MAICTVQSGVEYLLKHQQFENGDSWGAGYQHAKVVDDGVVVGPTGSNKNVLTQNFLIGNVTQVKVSGCGKAIDGNSTIGHVQVNWFNSDNEFIGSTVSKEYIGSDITPFETLINVPKGAYQGVFYVMPGGPDNVVNYSLMAMTATEYEPTTRDYLQKALDLPVGLHIGFAFVVLFAAIATWFKRSKVRLFITEKLAPTKPHKFLLNKLFNLYDRFFVIHAIIICALFLFALEPAYEQHYDSNWHQNSIDAVLKWNDFSIDLGGDILHNFGIQHVINPHLSPAFLIGTFFSDDLRVPGQAAIQAIIMLLLLMQLCRLSGMKNGDAAATSLIAVTALWVPFIVGEAVSFQAVLGLIWQEIANGALLTFILFTMVGNEHFSKRNQLIASISLFFVILWIFLAVPEGIPFYAIGTALICTGAVLASRSKKEILTKIGVTAVIGVFMLLIGMHNFVLNLFNFTPQMFYASLQDPQIVAHLYVMNSLFINAHILGGYFVYGFFALAAIGAVTLYLKGDKYGRNIIFAAICLEALIYLLNVINSTFQVLPLAFTYVEIVGISVVALLAAYTVWEVCKLFYKTFFFGVVWLVMLSPEKKDARNNVLKTFKPISQASALATLVIASNYCLEYIKADTNFYPGYPPSFVATPAKLLKEKLTVNPGNPFKGKALTLINMHSGPGARWFDAFLLHYYKYKAATNNDFMNDLENANIPVLNEYGHWMTPSSFAMAAIGFYRPDDFADRAARLFRRFDLKHARLLGVSYVISDQEIPGLKTVISTAMNDVGVLDGKVLDHPLYISEVPNPNLGQYSPTQTIVKTDAKSIIALLQSDNFDAETQAIVQSKKGLENLTKASNIKLLYKKGPVVKVQAQSKGRSLLVLPFDYSHCVQTEGVGIVDIIPVNFGLVGLVIEGSVSVDLTYQYGLLSGTSCRKDDLERLRVLKVNEAVEGTLFFDPRK